jgi:2-oxoglutarate-Fe(II)-dependent oxygenase superfamily protein
VTIELREVLASREWLRRESPFPHVIAKDVFQPSFYRALDDQLRQMLARGLSERPDRSRFSRNIPGYDAYGIGMRAPGEGAVALFLSRQWRDMVAAMFGIGTTPYVFAGAHHHTTGSAPGFVHNDFNPVFFPRADGDEIRSPDQDVCSYTTGAGTLPEADKVEVVRGVAVIFYLLNDGWRPGHGGETGLFASATPNVSEAAVRCPPENNSLVAFECTPRSFHTFLSNPGSPRTSIIMWIHRTHEEAAAKFGESRLERWQR